MKKDNKMPGVMRGVSPCADCTEKFTACHDNCPIDARGGYGYKAWLADVMAIKKKMNEYQSLNRGGRRWRRKTNT